MWLEKMKKILGKVSSNKGFEIYSNKNYLGYQYELASAMI